MPDLNIYTCMVSTSLTGSILAIPRNDSHERAPKQPDRDPAAEAQSR
ncbi:MAG: hypothetical protein ABSH41_07770 [Syntrophobacteraceae bacterium]